MATVQDPPKASAFLERVAEFSTRDGLAPLWHGWVKRAFDLAASTLSIPLVLPVLAIIAVLVRLDSDGPVLFLDQRLARDGRLFTCYKFRTMHLSSDDILRAHLARDPLAMAEWEQYRKLRGTDPRVTRIGRVLRKLSLDELPQIFNVLLGDMSLVGPRPYLKKERDLMGPSRGVIMQVRPGITGLWQVAGRNDIAFEDRLLLESWYAQNWSLRMDALILSRTIGVVLARRGAF